MTIYVVTGPPCAGKSHWVQEHAQPGDIIIDFDLIAQALTKGLNRTYPEHVTAVVRAARIAAMDTAILNGNCDIYIIHGEPSKQQLTKFRSLGATIITIDPGRDLVLARCQTQRPPHILDIAEKYYGAGQETDTGTKMDKMDKMDKLAKLLNLTKDNTLTPWW